MAVTPQLDLPVVFEDRDPDIPGSGTPFNAGAMNPNFDELTTVFNEHTHTDLATITALTLHEDSTTNVHGIADTSQLVLTNDARLTDQRVPVDGSVTDAKVAPGAAIAYSKLNLAGSVKVSDLAFTPILADQSLATSATIWLASRVTGDVQDRFAIKADGSMGWGSGALAPDIGLFRAGTSTLQTSGVFNGTAGFTAYGIQSSVNPFKVQVSGDTQDRFQINSNGKLAWGPGNVAVDTNLYRAGTAILASDSIFRFYAGLQAGNSSDTILRFFIDSNGVHNWGPGGTNARDTNLYRSSTGVLKTDGAMVFAGGSTSIGSPGGVTTSVLATNVVGTFGGFIAGVSGDAQGRFYVDTNGVLNWGNGTLTRDTNLYRGGPALVQSDGEIRTKTTGTGFATIRPTDTREPFNISADGKHQWSDGTNTVDTTLFRNTAGQLKTESLITTNGYSASLASSSTTAFASSYTGNAITPFIIQANGTMSWGDGTLTRDTNLYRSAANVLTSDDTIQSSRSATTSPAFSALVASDTVSRFIIGADGKLNWGSGTLTQDTNLYRSAAGVLTTDSMLIVLGNGITTKPSSAINVFSASIASDTNSRFTISTSGTLQWGSGSGATDITLLRAAAGQLTLGTSASSARLNTLNSSNGTVFAHYVSTEANPRFLMDSSGKQQWGSGTLAADTNLYRNGAGTLKTDTSLQIGGNLQVGSYQVLSATADPGVAAASSGRLYLKNNGSGKMQLVIQMPTGVPIVLATEV